LELFYGIRPNYCILYKLGIFVGLLKGTGAKKSKFSDQSHTGIALSCSNYTNGMRMFWDLTTSRFSISPDYSLDPTQSLASFFPELHYYGDFAPALVSGD
jgi:hypothetical protein